MNQQLRRRINRTLGAAGLAQLDDPGLFNQIAFSIRDHAHFRSMLIACEPALRRKMYDDIAANLRFKAHPLDTYLREAREDAEARRLPIQQPDGTLKEFQVPAIETRDFDNPHQDVGIPLQVIRSDDALDPQTSKKAAE